MEKNAFLPHIVQIPELCFKAGAQKCIISPGSRNAPLIAAFTRHPVLKSYVIPDERSAAFIGLGMALMTSRPTVLVCTSGTAVLNYFPAVAEAFYQEVPLLVLTADRPAELLDRHEGQTIRQRNVYGEHVKASFEIPNDLAFDGSRIFTAQILNRALSMALEEPKGPVHVNIPLREPLYPTSKQEIRFPEEVQTLQNIPVHNDLSELELNYITDLWNTHEKKLFVPGQLLPDSTQTELLRELCKNHFIPLVADITSNAFQVKDAIRHHDFFLGELSEEMQENLKPDLLITFGKSFLSKNLKNFIRKNRPKYHLHVDRGSKIADPTFSITHTISMSPNDFMEHFIKRKKILNDSKKYFTVWKDLDQEIFQRKRSFLNTEEEFSELAAVNTVLDRLPESTSLHLANSMPVRYANMLLDGHKHVKVYSNRGTCGIDGSVSTAVGAALASPEELHVLLSGDMSFFYDRNALWHTYVLPNLRIIILNNHGGDIFRMIDGPSSLPEAEEYLITTQRLNAKNTAADAGADYYFCETISMLNTHLDSFFNPSYVLKILEIKTNGYKNVEMFKKLKESFK